MSFVINFSKQRTCGLLIPAEESNDVKEHAKLHSWKAFAAAIANILDNVVFSTSDGAVLTVEQGFHLWVEKAMAMKERGSCLYLVGNGASASMSSHFSADINKNAEIHTQVFTDLSLVTAIANDNGFEHVFSYPLRRRAKAGDMLITISSSGRSPNILNAIEAALDMGLYVVTLSGMQPTNPSRSLGHLNIYTPAPTYGTTETAHAAILHYWTDLLVLQTPQQ